MPNIPNMQVSVEKSSPTQYRLAITVPSQEVEKAYAGQIKRMAQKANLRGFRPGKAPMPHIEKIFGDEAHREALTEVMRNALYEALMAHDIKPLGPPTIEPKMALANQPLEFIALVDVLPEIGKVEFSIDKLEKPVVEISAEDVSKVIDELRKQHAQWDIVDRPAEAQDRLVIDYYSVFEGEIDKENKGTGVAVELGNKTLLPGFSEGLLGSKAGEEKTLHITLPSDFPMPERAGKTVDFVVTVKQIFAAQTPELDTAFIQRLGISSGEADELNTQIKQSLEQERTRLVRNYLKDQVFNRLLELNSIEIPQTLIKEEAKRIHDEIHPHHEHGEHQHSAEETLLFENLARKRVTLGLLIAEYAKQTNTQVDQARVDARIQEIAASYQEPQQVLQWLSGKERRSGIEAQILEEQLLDKLMDGIVVSEKAMSYSELRGVQV